MGIELHFGGDRITCISKGGGEWFLRPESIFSLGDSTCTSKGGGEWFLRPESTFSLGDWTSTSKRGGGWSFLCPGGESEEVRAAKVRARERVRNNPIEHMVLV